jgi:hypothetical protein
MHPKGVADHGRRARLVKGSDPAANGAPARQPAAKAAHASAHAAEARLQAAIRRAGRISR